MLKTPHESIGQPPRKLCWEYPLGTVCGHFEEPPHDFVDPYTAEERKAIQELEKEEEEKWAAR